MFFVDKYKTLKILILKILCSVLATMLVTFILKKIIYEISALNKLLTIPKIEILYPQK